MDVRRWCIVSNVNRLKSSFGCAFVRVRTSLLWLRALYVKTRRRRQRERERKNGRHKQLCGLFCGATFKTVARSSSYRLSVTRKCFFAWHVISSLFLTEFAFASNHIISLAFISDLNCVFPLENINYTIRDRETMRKFP